MEAQEKKANDILQRELGQFYKEQSFEDVNNAESVMRKKLS